MSEIKRDAKGRFLKGNGEGCKFGKRGGDAAEVDAAEAGMKR